MIDLAASEVEEVDVVSGPFEVWPGEKELPPMKTTSDWNDFLAGYDLSEVFRRGEVVSLSSTGLRVRTTMTPSLVDSLLNEQRRIRLGRP